MTQNPDRADLHDETDETDESTESILQSTLDLVDQVVDQITSDDVQARLTKLLRLGAIGAAMTNATASGAAEWDTVVSDPTCPPDEELATATDVDAVLGSILATRRPHGGLHAESSMDLAAALFNAPAPGCPNTQGESDQLIQLMDDCRAAGAVTSDRDGPTAAGGGTAGQLHAEVQGLYERVFADADEIVREAVARAERIERQAREKADRLYNEALDNALAIREQARQEVLHSHEELATARALREEAEATLLEARRERVQEAVTRAAATAKEPVPGFDLAFDRLLERGGRSAARGGRQLGQQMSSLVRLADDLTAMPATGGVDHVDAPSRRDDNAAPLHGRLDKCSEVLDQMFAYVDGELSEPELHRVREHLDGWEPCAAEHDVDNMVKTLIIGDARATGSKGGQDFVATAADAQCVLLLELATGPRVHMSVGFGKNSIMNASRSTEVPQWVIGEPAGRTNDVTACRSLRRGWSVTYLLIDNVFLGGALSDERWLARWVLMNASANRRLASQEIQRIHFHHCSDPFQRPEREIALASLDATHVSAVHTNEVSEGLLAEATLSPVAAE